MISAGSVRVVPISAVRGPTIADRFVNDAPLLLVYAQSLQASDGTTVQLRRLLADFPTPIWHIHWRMAAAFSDLPRNYLSLPVPPEPSYPFRRGAGFLRRTWRRWVVPPFVRSRLARAVRSSRQPRPQVAYVVVFDEMNAIFAREVLRAARIDRYVLHLMDLFHAHFDPRAQPAFAALIANASGVLAVSKRLADVIAPVARQPVEILPLVTGFEQPAAPASPAVPYLMMSGALYAADPSKLNFLHSAVVPAWQELAREISGIEWRYSGAQAYAFSPALRGLIKNCGLLPQPAWCETLAGARCALLPVMHRADDHYRFSVPSRLVDYLAAGVPVIAPSSPNTATGDFLDTFSHRGVIIANTAAEVHAALKRLFLDDDFHRQHAVAAQSAAPLFSIDRSRQRLREVFQRIASSPSHRG